MNIVLNIFLPNKDTFDETSNVPNGHIFKTRVFEIYHYDSEFDVENRGIKIYYCTLHEYKTFRKHLNQLCKENSMFYYINKCRSCDIEIMINNEIVHNKFLVKFLKRLYKLCDHGKLSRKNFDNLKYSIYRKLETKDIWYTDILYLKERFYGAFENA